MKTITKSPGKITIIILVILLLCIAVPVSATINITAIPITSSAITWNWDPALNVTSMTIDGMYICNYNSYAGSFVLSELPANESHTIIIATPTDSGRNTAITLIDSNVEQSTGLLVLINTWFLVGAILLLFLCGFAIHWFLLWIGSFVALYGLADYILKHGPIETSIWNLPFLIYGALFVLGFVLWAFRRKRR